MTDNKTPTAVAIIQARMGSERLPGKSMELIGGIPVIELVLKRLSKAQRISRVVLATSNLSRDDVLAETAAASGFSVFRGSESDLVERFVTAAETFGEGPYIVRATGDNVFMDWNEIDRVVEFGIEGGWDFVGFENAVHPNRLNDFGGEFIRRPALEQVSNETTDAHDREHVFPYFYANPDKFKVTRIAVNPNLHTPVKLDLDYAEDLRTLQDIGEQVDDPVSAPAAEIVRIATFGVNRAT